MGTIEHKGLNMIKPCPEKQKRRAGEDAHDDETLASGLRAPIPSVRTHLSSHVPKELNLGR